MTCNQAKSLFSPYLDGVLNGAERITVSRHLETCSSCTQEYTSLDRTQSLLSALGRKPAPPDLALKLRVAVSQEISMSWQKRYQRVLNRVEEAINAFMLPATAGLVTAILMFGLLIGSFMSIPKGVSANSDVPTMLYTPPKLASAPFSDSFIINAETPVMIEALVDANGRLQDYRIISGKDDRDIRKQLDRSLIFTVFEPAKSFGQPAPGKVVLSFANIDVKG
ncbi:MAG TPA: zf-HC2 domain-containing protein [Terriglobales bacterium]|nr:zf-HC2 domain-containing protein [Terriglobales bacterium]